MSDLSVTTLEVLSPELFIEIFRFLNGYDIYKAFYGLNHRLSALVLKYGINYIDLSEIRLYQIRKIFSGIDGSKVNTLKLSSKYNDEQIDQILNNYFQSSIFNQLRSLTLDSVGIFTIHSIMHQQLIFVDLQSLIIRFRSDVCQEKLRMAYGSIFNNIHLRRFKSLELLNLSILDFEKSSISQNLIFIDFSLISPQIYPSLKYLYIHNVRIRSIETIFSCFPNLYGLNASFTLNRFMLGDSLLNLTSCKLEIHSTEFDFIIRLLKQCSNLKKLILCINPVDADDLDNIRWENLIENNLLNLKKFQVNMIVQGVSIDLIRDLYMNSFLQNKFWIERKTEFNVEPKSPDDLNSNIEVMIKFSI